MRLFPNPKADANAPAVHALFSRYGTITQFKVLLAKGTNAFTGEALVRLGSIEQADYAIRYTLFLCYKKKKAAHATLVAEGLIH